MKTLAHLSRADRAILDGIVSGDDDGDCPADLGVAIVDDQDGKPLGVIDKGGIPVGIAIMRFLARVSDVTPSAYFRDADTGVETLMFPGGLKWQRLDGHWRPAPIEFANERFA